jgi:hypothetical protein
MNKEYHREYSREWHQRNKDRRREQRRQRRQDNLQRYRDFKKTLKCERCGFSDYRALHFHHLVDKEYNPSSMLGEGMSWDKFLREIEKCIVLCANCHSIEHYPKDQ